MEWSTYYNCVVPVFEKLKGEGRINGWGITAASTQETNIGAIGAAVHPDVVQCITNVLDSPGEMTITRETPQPRDVIAAAKKRGIGVMGVRAVAAGSLTNKIDRSVELRSREQRDFEKAEMFRALAAETGTTAAKLAHRYALAMDGVDTVVLGVKNRTELLECIESEAQSMPGPELLQRIDDSVA